MNDLDNYYYRRISIAGNDEIDLEKDREDNFRRCHVCPDLEPHHREEFECILSSSNASGIGVNTYIKCMRCGCQQDITNYGVW